MAQPSYFDLKLELVEDAPYFLCKEMQPYSATLLCKNKVLAKENLKNKDQRKFKVFEKTIFPAHDNRIQRR